MEHSTGPFGAPAEAGPDHSDQRVSGNGETKGRLHDDNNNKNDQAEGENFMPFMRAGKRGGASPPARDVGPGWGWI